MTKKAKPDAQAVARSGSFAEALTKARTSTPDYDAAARICGRLAEGEPMDKAAIAEGTDRRRFLEWVRQDEALADNYVRARAASADAGRDRYYAIMARLENGEIDAATARVLLDGLKWDMGKMQPKVYGDKLELEHAGTLGLPEMTKATDSLNAMLAGLAALGAK